MSENIEIQKYTSETLTEKLNEGRDSDKKLTEDQVKGIFTILEVQELTITQEKLSEIKDDIKNKNSKDALTILKGALESIRDEAKTGISGLKSDVESSIKGKKKQIRDDFITNNSWMPDFVKESIPFLDGSEKMPDFELMKPSTWDFGKRISIAIAGVVAGFFGFDKYLESIKTVDTEQAEQVVAEARKRVQQDQANPSVKESIEDKEAKIIPDTSNETVKEDIEQNREKLINGYTFVGRGFLILSAGKLERDEKTSGTLIKDLLESKMTYRQIKGVFNTMIQGINGDNIKENTLNALGLDGSRYENVKKDTLLKYLGILASPRSDFIAKSYLSDINKIVTSDKFIEKFGKEKSDALKDKTSDELTMKEFLFLLGYAMPVGAIGYASTLALGIMPDLDGDDLKEYKEQLKAEVEERKSSFISTELLTILQEVGVTNTDYLNQPGMVTDKINELKDKTENEKQRLLNEFEKIKGFKEKVFTALGKEEFHLDITDFQAKYIQTMTYNDIVGLYLLLDGIADFESKDSVSRPVFYTWISRLQKNSNGVEYFTALFTKTQTIKESKKYLSEEQQDLLMGFIPEGALSIISPILEKATAFTQGTREGVKGLLGSRFPGLNYNAEYMKNIDYVLLAVLLLGSYGIYKIPMPLPWKFAISGLFTLGGTTQILGILNDRGVIDEFVADQSQPEVVKQALREMKEDNSSSGGGVVSDVISGVVDFFKGLGK